MLNRARRAACLALAAVLLAALPAAPALAQKQTVVIYTAIENEQIAEYRKSYEKALPNLDVKMLRFSTGDISARFVAEKDNMQADLIWGVAATNMLQFKQMGLLVPYAPKGLERIQPLFRDKANPPSWVGIDIFMSAFCFNTEVAKKHNLPKPASWAEYTKSGSKPCKDSAAGERGIGVSFEYVAMEMKKKGAPVEMVLPKEGSGYEIEANALTKKGANNSAAKQFLDWAISDDSLRLVANFFAAVSVPGFPVPEGLPKDISKVVFPNDFEWSAKNRDRILAEWQKRYAK